ncbi:MAG: OmpA family protein [Cytophagaceae bacterium]|nr:OmpA family protein [Cytophagaceae bacterium]MDW8457405.1 OmpA family protein [Cytophagaceae bacterium]
MDIKLLLIPLTMILCSRLVALSQDVQPDENNALFEIYVTDPDKIPEEGAQVFIESEDMSFKNSAITDVDGIAKLLVPEGKKYKFTVKKFGHTFEFNEYVEVAAKEGAYIIEQNLNIKLIRHYVRNYNLDHMYFDVNKWDIKEESIPTLNKLVESLNKNKKLVIEIAGHTDNVGKDADNMRLSQRRANAIRDYLISKGISEKRLLAKGYGEKFPLVSNDTEEGRAKNRRTEIRVIQE